MSDSAVFEFAKPVWINAKKVKDAIGIFEAIALHATELNESSHSNFFGILQQNFCIEMAVVNIAKIYDSGSKNYQKHTVYDIIAYLDKRADDAELWGYTDERLAALNIPESLILKTSRRDNEDAIRVSAIREIVDILRITIPTRETNENLDKIISYRNKIAAHQEELSLAQREWFKSLPPVEEFIKLALLSEHLAGLLCALFTNTCLLPHTWPSAYMSTLNLLIKALDKDFENTQDPEVWRAYEDFFGRAKA